MTQLSALSRQLLASVRRSELGHGNRMKDSPSVIQVSIGAFCRPYWAAGLFWRAYLTLKRGANNLCACGAPQVRY
jgi:hypothetical protein